MAKNDDVSIFDELNSRLDDLFADDDLFSEDSEIAADDEITTAFIESELPVVDSVNIETVQSPAPDKTNHFFDSEKPLHQLKAIVLEMDWEISDENLSRYLSEINKLITFYKEDRPIYLFFKLHLTIGEYMLSKKARAHPAALRFLYSVFNSLEKALQPSLPRVEKNKLILEEVQNFKNLKMKLFPDFYKTELNNNSVFNKPADILKSNLIDHKDENSEVLDISTFPDNIQQGINKYIEKSISEKIDAIKKELGNN